MAAIMEAFRYRPLPEAAEWIRILHLEPSTQPDAPLRGRLVETKLDAQANYHAVSYLWGDTKVPLTDCCELRMVTTGMSGTEHNYARLPILASCNTVLRHLRRARMIRKLWIDSVCIDQSNPVEKSQQVRIMQYIYRDASKVAMWLDLSHLPTGHCKRIFKSAKILSYAYKCGLVDIFDKDRATNSLERWFKRSFPSGTLMDTLVSIFENPYFGRAWTVQELVIAPLSRIEMHSSVGTVRWAHILALVEFQFGGSIDHDVIEEVVRVHRRLSCRGSFAGDNSVLRKSPKKLWTRSESRLIDQWHAEGPVYPFQDISFLLASEPRDKAYAFLWALKACRPVEFDVFNVDYAKTVETVFTEFTITVAHDTGDFVALLQSACRQNKMFTLPSWVPDWSQQPSQQEGYFQRRIARSVRLMEHFEHPHLSDQEGPTFQDAAMHIRGLRHPDRVSRLERMPDLLTNDSALPGPDLYSPHAIEGLCVALNKVLQMLDDPDDLDRLSRFSPYAMSGAAEESFVNPNALAWLVPEALDKPCVLSYTILRGIVRSYIQSKRSSKPSDVDVSEWSRGLTAELKNIFMEDTIEYLLQVLSSYKDHPHGTLSTRDFETHIVIKLISVVTSITRVFFMEAIFFEFSLGKLGATIFKTEGNSLGLGQANISVGDKVVQWKGVSCPTVVRMFETGKDFESRPEEIHCRLVSVAEVDGITGIEKDWRGEDLITYVVR